MKTIYNILRISAIALAFQFSANATKIKLYLTGGVTEVNGTKHVLKKFKSDNPDIEIELQLAPSTTTEVFNFYLQLFEAKSGETDVLCIDDSWFMDLSENLLDLSNYLEKSDIEKYYENIMGNYIVDNKIKALPWYSDVGLLFYRKDLLDKYKLSIPKTWVELTKSAFIIQEQERANGNPDFVGYVWQGKSYEGLTCNALEWIYSNEGGTIINDKKEITINNQNAVEAVSFSAQWIGTISPVGVLSMDESMSQEVFASGNAAFLRSWPYLFSVFNKEGIVVKDTFNATAIPAGKLGINAGMIGGWTIGVNKYSKHPDEAVKLAKFLTSEYVQKYRALNSGNAPNIESLYKDKEIASRQEYQIIEKALPNGFSRPFKQSYPYYNYVSQIFIKEIYNALRGKIDTETALEELANDLHNKTKLPIKKD